MERWNLLLYSVVTICVEQMLVSRTLASVDNVPRTETTTNVIVKLGGQAKTVTSVRYFNIKNIIIVTLHQYAVCIHVHLMWSKLVSK